MSARVRLGAGWFLLLGALLLCAQSFAADVSVTAYANRQKAAVGETVVLTVSVHGASNATPPQLPAIEGLQLVSTSMSTRLVTGTAGFQAEVDFLYYLQAMKTGTFEIPPLDVQLGKTIYKTEPIKVEVSQPPTPQPGAEQERSPSTGGKLFLRAFADTNKAYVGQQISVTLQLLWADVSIAGPTQSPVPADGFRAVSLGQPTQTVKVIDGVSHNCVEVVTAYFPLVPGKLSIGPFNVQCDLLLARQPGRTPPNSIDDFFNMDVDSFFGSYSRKPVELTADVIPIEVSALPEQGKPSAFSGAVGTFYVTAALQPDQVNVGDGATLTMTVRGEGDLQNSAASMIAGSDSLRAFPPEVSYEVLPSTGKFLSQKTFKQLVVVESDGVKEIPSVEFSYFDPRKESYVVVSRGPFPVSVKGAGIPLHTASAPAPAKAEVPLVSRGLFGIKTDVRPFAASSLNLWLSPAVLVPVASLPALGVLISFFVSIRLNRIRQDRGYARALRARKKALSELNSSRALGGDICSATARVLCGFIADKLDLNPGVVTAETIGQHLRSAGVPDKLAEEVSVLLHTCDHARFSGRTSSQEDDGALPASAAKLISKLDKAIPAK